MLASAWHITDGGWSALNLEKSEDRLSENVEGVKEAKIVKSERHTGCYFVLLAVAAPRLKTR